MQRRQSSGTKVIAGAVFAALVSGAATALPAASDDVDAIVQTLADLTLIDGTCHDLTVNFGIGFEFAREHGLSATAVMPTGPLRKAFEADFRDSATGYTPDVTCGVLAMHYSIAVPGSVTFPVSSSRRDGS